MGAKPSPAVLSGLAVAVRCEHEPDLAPGLEEQFDLRANNFGSERLETSSELQPGFGKPSGHKTRRFGERSIVGEAVSTDSGFL